jgi:NADPH2:quinone reductase
MQAVIVRRFGGPEVLELADVPLPEPGAGQVRVRVDAAAVNPVDIATRAGALADAGLMRPGPQVGIGWDVAGRVDAVGAGVRGFARGDRVIGVRDLLPAPLGAQAEHLVLDARALAPAPRRASPAEAAVLGLSALTAAQALDKLTLAPGQTLLVTGAAGAVGGFALELAASAGYRTVAVARAGDESLVSELGAEWFAEPTSQLGAAVRRLVPGGVDGALDAAAIGMPALDGVRNGGAYVSLVAGAAPLPLRGTRVHQQWIAADGVRLAGLSALADSGRLTLRVADTLPLDAVADAHRRLERDRPRGRLVLVT